MLGKLIKYDFKVQLKFLGGVYGVLLAVALIACGLLALRNAFSDITPITFANDMVHLFLMIAAVLTVVVTFLYGILYFRRNLFKDEGYLMNTLPVTGTQLYMSKLITCTLCSILSCVIALLLYGVGRQDILWFVDIVDKMDTVLTGGTVGVALPMTVSFLVMIPTTLIQIFMCICVGYTWKIQENMNRDVLSVIVYVVCYFAQQILMLVALLVFFLIAFQGISFHEIEETLNQAENVEKYFRSILYAGTGYSIVIAGIMLIISLRKMNRCINLD